MKKVSISGTNVDVFCDNQAVKNGAVYDFVGDICFDFKDYESIPFAKTVHVSKPAMKIEFVSTIAKEWVSGKKTPSKDDGINFYGYSFSEDTVLAYTTVDDQKIVIEGSTFTLFITDVFMEDISQGKDSTKFSIKPEFLKILAQKKLGSIVGDYAESMHKYMPIPIDVDAIRNSNNSCRKISVRGVFGGIESYKDTPDFMLYSFPEHCKLTFEIP